MSPKKDKQKSAKSTAAAGKTYKGLSAEEIAAMKETLKERKAEARWSKNKEEGESAALAAIAAMKGLDHALAKRIHEIVKSSAPSLLAKTWYGMPAYANKDGKVVCFFRNASKFKERYAMLGFNDSANLDDGSIWPIAFALKELTNADEARIAKLVKQAVS
jgi:uncharacterized protein YdhG (YjbR/CyaY superfamily)